MRRRPRPDELLVPGKTIVSVDTNVLFKLYKVSASVRNIYLEIFEALQESAMVIPADVVWEFWKNRASVIGFLWCLVHKAPTGTGSSTLGRGMCGAG